MKKVLLSWITNVVLAVVAAVLCIMQEYWSGIMPPFLNILVYGACVAAGFALVAEMLKTFVGYAFSIRKVAIGIAAGIVATLITALVVC